MSQHPTPPIDYARIEPVIRRPTSITVIAILGIILGSVGFLCLPMAIIPYFLQIPAPPGQSSNPAMIVVDTVKNDPLLFGWTMAVNAMNWILSAIVLAGSIGALGLKQWARQLLIGWAITQLFLGLVQSVFHFIVFVPRMHQMAAANPGNPVAVAAGSGGWIGITTGVVLGMGIPTVVLIILNRANVKDAFNRGFKPVI